MNYGFKSRHSDQLINPHFTPFEELSDGVFLCKKIQFLFVYSNEISEILLTWS